MAMVRELAPASGRQGLDAKWLGDVRQTVAPQKFLRLYRDDVIIPLRGKTLAVLEYLRARD